MGVVVVVMGFVGDDGVVVVENVMCQMEGGKTALCAALDGAREIGFSVVSMSLSLIAVFVPILFMGGIVGRFFREFAVVMSAAILISMVVSLTTTPMMCAALLRSHRLPAKQRPRRRLGRAWDRFAAWMGRVERRAMSGYRASLAAKR